MPGIFGRFLPRPAAPTVRSQRQRPVRAHSAPIGVYTGRVDNIPLAGAQILATVANDGTAHGQVGPTGLGTVWYPASVALSTNVLPFDASTVQVFVGPSGVPTTNVGILPAGGTGVLALAIPAMSPGLVIIVQWTGATPGSVVAANVTGTMSALTWVR